MANNEEAVAISTEVSGPHESKPKSSDNVVDLTSNEAEQSDSQSSTLAPAVTTPTTGSTTTTSSSTESSERSSSTGTSPSQPNEQPVQQLKPILVPLGSGSAPSTQPKRFSTVNINKKFLEKTHNTSPAPSTSTSIKTGNLISRTTSSSSSTPHPRLITTKLTANSQSPSAPGPGWSRPSSVTPPVAPNSNATTPNGAKHPTNSTAGATLSGGPHVPPVGKVIQPQPRSAAPASLQKNASISGSNKPVWGNVARTGLGNVARTGLGTARANSNDFPTAAEVALGTSKTLKAAEMKEAEEEASKQARSEEADTFRGLHLDPNAHHWDEEEDDDNFLDGVIEFGDGRQYKVDSNPTQTAELTDDSTRQVPPHLEAPSNAPVSKEERFVDDFDRSWPRGHAPGRLDTSSTSRASPTTSGPQETSKVLFNERSNRLEPYSNTRTSYQSKRGHQPEHSPTEYRDSRITLNQHSAPGIQLLQKNESYSHSRRRSGDAASPRDYAPAGSKFVDPSEHHRGRQHPIMGPPPVPPHALHDSRDPGHQFPPSVPTGRQSSRDSRYSSHSHSGHPPIPPPARQPSQSPALSHASAVLSPIVDPATLNMSTEELETVKKDLMHNAAARAKQRRQQEEEERERQKERARQRALALEQRVAEQPAAEAALSQEKENEVRTEDHQAVEVIEEAIKDAKAEAGARPLHEKHSRRPSLRSTNSQVHYEPAFPRRVSFSRSPGSTTILPTTQVDTTDSWRTKSAHPSPSQSIKQTPSFTSQPPSALDHAKSLAEDPEADLEVVDYSDLGKFVGVEDESSQNQVEETSRPSPVIESSTSRRAVASDFFEDDAPIPPPETTKLKSDDKVWRKREKTEDPPAPIPPPHVSRAVVTTVVTETSVVTSAATSTTTTPEQAVTSSPPQPTRHNRKEAAMSALDNAMSRVKQALDGYKEPTQPRDADSSKRPVVPPSHTKAFLQRESRGPTQRPLRVDVAPTENFLFTAAEPPRSPKPAWNQFLVRLPTKSAPVDPIPKRQLHFFFKRDHYRWWEFLSFTPPVEGMNRRDLSLNDVLFRRAHAVGYKGRNKYRVCLPGAASAAPQPASYDSGHRPPLNRAPTGGAFGKPTVADDASTWRKRVVSVEPTAPITLDTTSRSPPPLTTWPTTATVALSKEGSPKEETKDLAGVLKSRSQPKMPVGSGVAFYKDSRIVEVDAQTKPAVSFFAISEQESSSTVKKDAQVVNGVVSTIGSKIPALDKHLSPAESPNHHTYGLPALVSSSNKTESKSSEDSPDRIPITPPHQGHTPTWSTRTLSMPLKDSPSRAPDPELLKAVWSQPSHKSELHPVNSLEGIADDLTSLPFTILDVKSEDGGTPPPTIPNAPSRMSLHDVTKAFQQVPTSNASPNTHPLRPTISPPSTTAPVARPPQGFSYSSSNPSSAPNVRPNYPYPPPSHHPHHPSPIMSHAAAPLYPHPMNGSPIPSRMAVSGHTPIFSPVWVPLPNGAGQAPASMMRPPYPPPGMYPSPGTPHGMYHPLPNMQNPSAASPQQGSHLNRGRGSAPMMSPAMTHAGAVPPMPMYAGSPVMLPAHAGRPPMRNDNHHSQHHAQHPPPVHHPTQAYTPVPNPSFGGVRPPW